MACAVTFLFVTSPLVMSSPVPQGAIALLCLLACSFRVSALRWLQNSRMHVLTLEKWVFLFSQKRKTTLQFCCWCCCCCWSAADDDDGMCSTHSWLVKWLRCCCCCCSTWVMMNQDTRRLSKMPKEVLDEISPYFLDRSVMKDNDRCQRIKKLTDTAPYIRSDLVVSPNHWFHNAMQFWTMLDGWSQLSTNALFLCGGAVHFLHNIWYMMIWELSVISHKCMDLFLGCWFCSHVWMIWIWTSMWIM